MFIGRPPGNYDRLLDFSRAVTGNLFFVPSRGFSGRRRGDGRTGRGGRPPPTDPEPIPPARDGSLGIGSLKGDPLT